MAIFDKMDSAASVVVLVDAQTDTVGFYHMNGADRSTIQYNTIGCKSKFLNDEFFQKFEKALKLFREKYPQVPTRKITLVLPDHLFLTDTVKVPMIHRKAVNNSLELALETIYKGKENLALNKEILQQNKQQVTFAVAGIRKDLLSRLKEVCEENGMGVQNVTSAANTLANGAALLNPKVKAENYILLDIKEKFARLVIVVRGKALGCHTLPFGYSILGRSRRASEDTLFDHASGELLVLNAKEKARSKQLTIGEAGIVSAAEEDEGFEEFEVDAEPAGDEENANEPQKRTARKLPKFMIRPTPETMEGYIFENFRLFAKWALELAASNPEITEAGKPETVYVNMPNEFACVYDMINAPQEGTGIPFAPLTTERGNSKRILRHLELYGGFNISQNNKNGIF